MSVATHAYSDAHTLSSQCKASASWDLQKILTVRSWAFMSVCILVTVASALTFDFLADIIYTHAIPNEKALKRSELLMFDVRNGYTPEEVAQTLRAWRTSGEAINNFVASP
jgi:hypothetical protein